VISRARSILAALEEDAMARGGRPSLTGQPAANRQQLGSSTRQRPSTPWGKRLREIDVDRLTPLEALTLLADLKRGIEEP